MQSLSLAFARYWRNSLLDAQSEQGKFRTVDPTKTRAFAWALPDTSVEVFPRVEAKAVKVLFSGVVSDRDTIKVLIRPLVFKARTVHGKAVEGIPETATPVVFDAIMNRAGWVIPTSAPRIPRDLLSPQGNDAFTAGELLAHDDFLSCTQWPSFEDITFDNAFEPESATVAPNTIPSTRFLQTWSDHWGFTYRLIDEVLGDGPLGLRSASDLFYRVDYGLVECPDSIPGAARHVVRLLDYLLSKPNVEVPLFDQYASTVVKPSEPLISSDSMVQARLGHSSDIHPLASAQRDALSHFLRTGVGDIFAVNGPPGTGKTTLLLSTVATLWVKAAISGELPDLIVAASTNNQAVTNVIDAFGKDFSAGVGPLAGRWLPDVKSYGSYLPSADKQAAAAAKYQTKAFFEAMETPAYISRAETAYLTAAQAAYPDVATLDDAVSCLHGEILRLANLLETLQKAWATVRQATADFDIVVQSGETPSAALTRLRRDVRTTDIAKTETAELASGLNAALSKRRLGTVILESLFSWLPVVAQRSATLALAGMAGAASQLDAFLTDEDKRSIPAIQSAIARQGRILAAQYRKAKNHLDRAEQLHEALEASREAWMIAVCRYRCEHNPGVVAGNGEFVSMQALDPELDTVIRFRLFRLTTHYWEGRWLREVKQIGADVASRGARRGVSPMTAWWKTRMMITPCVVSTFHMLPAHFMGSTHSAQGFQDLPLINAIDLLIVDEAGMVQPELASASFALAKRAKVIGDTLQLPPIWAISRSVDKGNLADEGLLADTEDPDDAYAYLNDDLGKTAGGGNVMRIAQSASRWHYNPALGRGMYLYEHRRCHDPIIDYCNRLCYQNQLQPKAGPKPPPPSGDGLPPMGYLHIHGRCVTASSGSRANRYEALVIGQWLLANRLRLEAHYGMPLGDIVGVVSPFRGQVELVTRTLRDAGMKVGSEPGEMTVGTVHALQGAERPVVIFSPVYSKHQDGRFIDKDNSMLNVAVSRAKFSFLVFGDMDVVNMAPQASPRGLLAQVLFADPNNALSFDLPPRPDLSPAGGEDGVHSTADSRTANVIGPYAGDLKRQGAQMLRNAPDHDSFLRDVIKAAAESIAIVTPWIRPGCAPELGILEPIREAAARGVKVDVYYDEEANLRQTGMGSKDPNRVAFADALNELRAAGARPIRLRRVHSKAVVSDGRILCIGSFNWLSARRDHQARHETSIAHIDDRIGAEIKVLLDSLTMQKIST